MQQPTSAIADTICRTTELGVTITGAAVDSQDRTRIFCEVLDPNPRCPNCGNPGQARDMADRTLTDTPAAGRPVLLHVTVPRFACRTADCPLIRPPITIEAEAGQLLRGAFPGSLTDRGERLCTGQDCGDGYREHA